MTFDDTKQASKHSTCSFPNRIIPTSKYLQPLQFSPRIPWIHRCRLYRWVSWGSHLDRQLYDGYNMPVVWGNISIYIYIYVVCFDGSMNQPVPSNLWRVLNTAQLSCMLRVMGDALNIKMQETKSLGYFTWKSAIVMNWSPRRTDLTTSWGTCGNGFDVWQLFITCVTKATLKASCHLDPWAESRQWLTNLDSSSGQASLPWSLKKPTEQNSIDSQRYRTAKSQCCSQPARDRIMINTRVNGRNPVHPM